MVGGCRQDLPVPGLGTDRVDQDPQRDFSVPPALAGGYAFDSNRELRETARVLLNLSNDRQGA